MYEIRESEAFAKCINQARSEHPSVDHAVKWITKPAINATGYDRTDMTGNRDK
jgi:hypothetical protein